MGLVTDKVESELGERIKVNRPPNKLVQALPLQVHLITVLASLLKSI